MDVREKLIEILRKPIFPHELVDPVEAVADYLLDSGVTVQEWVSVKDRFPESNKAVLVSARCKTFGFRYTLKATHIGHHEATTEDYEWREYEGNTEYDEEKDCFWIPECWWEDNFMEGNNNWIIDSDLEVTHWMPLPQPPKGE